MMSKIAARADELFVSSNALNLSKEEEGESREEDEVFSLLLVASGLASQHSTTMFMGCAGQNTSHKPAD